MSRSTSAFIGAASVLVVAYLLAGSPETPEVARSMLAPAVSLAVATVLAAYGAVDPRPCPRWYDKLTFVALYVTAVVVFAVLAGQVDYWYSRLGVWCLVVHLAAGLVLAATTVYHTFSSVVRQPGRG